MQKLPAEELFARGVWTIIPDTEDVSWVDRVAALPGSDEPLGDYGTLVRRFLEAGIPAADIARFARIVGYEVAFEMSYYLGDPSCAYKGFIDHQDNLVWSLFEIDPATDEPRQPITGVHEVLLGSDPSGREMRPSRE